VLFALNNFTPVSVFSYAHLGDQYPTKMAGLKTAMISMRLIKAHFYLAVVFMTAADGAPSRYPSS
jgi:hypothetical protein